MIPLTAAAILLAAAWLWYSRPLTLYGDGDLPVRTAQHKGWLSKVLFPAQAAEG